MATRHAMIAFCVGFVVDWTSSDQLPATASGISKGPEQLPGPISPASWPSWLEGIEAQRKKELASIHYNGSIFSVGALKWTQTAYIQPQVHPFDRFLYDHVDHRYTIDRFLDDVVQRNQFDLFRSAPGGLEGIRKLANGLRERGVYTLLPYNPWDTATRRESTDDATAMARLMLDTETAGLNCDTCWYAPLSFYTASLALDHPAALESEGGGSLESMGWTTLGWGEDWKYPWVPMVDHWKWLDSRRLTNVVDRWSRNRTDDLHAVWFNADGYEAWENIWGSWNGITPRDGEAIRRVGAMLRFFGLRGLLQATGWQPHYPTLQSDSVFSSLYTPLGIDICHGKTSAVGRRLVVPHSPGRLYYDCYRGSVLSPLGVNEGNVTLSFRIEGLGYGCVVATTSLDSELLVFLQKMGAMTKRDLKTFSSNWTCLAMSIEPVVSTHMFESAPSGMVSVPAVEAFPFVVRGVELEGPFGVDFAYPFEHNEGCPIRHHNVTIPYLNDTGYIPRDPTNFLRHWSNGMYPSGWGRKPVTWITREEAQSYCRHQEKRLPTEWEWQRAAQGNEGRLFPWGGADDPSRRPTTSHTMVNGPDDVDAHPEGRSPFGVEDLVGNVWQWTDEFVDLHTRSAVLRGSSYYTPGGVNDPPYFPQALSLDTHNKYLLWDESYDRSGGIGFRCAVDAA